MRKIILLSLLSLFSFALFSQSNIPFDYQIITLDSNYNSSSVNCPESDQLQSFLHQKKKNLQQSMDIIIGNSKEELSSFSPQSPLSNLIVDALFEYGNHYFNQYSGKTTDLAILNFGGIRTSLPAGNITIGNIYQILPFDNTVVIVSLTGENLLKVLKRFTPKSCQPIANTSINFHQYVPYEIKVGNQPIDLQAIYYLTTIDFIQTGGDEILKDIEVIEVIPTNTPIRDVFINFIKAENARGKSVTASLDQRIIIMPQY